MLGGIAQMWRPGGQVVPLDGLADFTAFARPGFAKAALSFTFSAEGRATRAATETRVQATDDAARRAFGRYWLVVGPFSGLIRRRWLAAIAARAEAQK